MESSRRFKPPWSLIRENSESYIVRDANGVTLAWVFCRDDSQLYSFGAGKLTSEEARQISKAIARIPEFMMQRQGFYSSSRSAALAPIVIPALRTIGFVRFSGFAISPPN